MTEPRVASIAAPVTPVEAARHHPPGDFAFVDLETTGTDPSRDRITEIGIVRIRDGIVADEWSTLIDPGRPIPPEIQALTGISNAMVRDAPAFASVADLVRSRLTGHVFVAHNARFDYGFLKAEYRRLGDRFQAEVLCTVRLSRKLYPDQARHGLDALVARHRLGDEGRHRALGDAKLIARFLSRASDDLGPDVVDEAIVQLLKRPARPGNLPEGALEDIPETPGVYTFLGVNGQPLYIGKARNLRERVRSHFYADSSNSTDARLAAEAHGLEFEETAGELSALFREIQLIHRHAPLHNLALRRREANVFLRIDDRGLPVFLPLAEFDPTATDGLHGPFSSRPAARAALAALARDHRLCDRAIGLWTGERPCFSRQIGRCLGLCSGEESPDAHRARLIAALTPLRFPSWPFNGTASLTETCAESGRTSVLHFDRWCAIDPARPQHGEFHPEMFKLLRRVLKRGSATFLQIDR